MKKDYVLNLLIFAKLIQFSSIVFIFYNFPNIIINLIILGIAEIIKLCLRFIIKKNFKKYKKK